MLITRNNAVHYLLERRLLDMDAIVDGDVMVVEAPRRNNNIKIVRRHGPGYFMKQVLSWEERDVASLRREATCYWMAASEPRFSALAAMMPKYYGYDRDRSILVTELLGADENLTEFHQRLGRFPASVGTALGEALGAYHRDVRDSALNPQQAAAFPREVPWILSAHEVLTSAGSVSNPGAAQLAGILQRHTGFRQQLEALRTAWSGNSLVHGDLKWDNVTVREAGDGVELRVIDWEMADFGDPCWDAGAIFQSYISYWVLSIPIAGPMTPEQIAASAPHPIESMQPALQAFWTAYTAAMKIREPEASDLLRRSLAFAAARMIQTSYEWVHHAGVMAPNVVLLMQVSLNILSNPTQAVSQLVGMAS